MVAMALSAAAPTMAVARSVAGSRFAELCSCRSSSPSSSFLGSGVHASALSPVFQFDRISPRILPIQRSRSGAQNFVVRGLFGLGVPELAVIAGVAAILFGPKKLPEIGKSLGKTVKSFQQAAKEFESEIKNPQEAAGTDVASTEQPTTSSSSSSVSSTPTTPIAPSPPKDKEVV